MDKNINKHLLDDILNYKLNLVFDKEDDIKEHYKVYPDMKIKFKKIMDNANLVKIVYNQGKRSSCTANSIANALKSSINPSRGFIYYISRPNKDRDDGVSILTSIKSVSLYGYCGEELYPYDNPINKEPSTKAYKDALKRKGISYSAIDNKKIFLKNEIYNKHLIVFGAKLYTSFLKVGKDGMIKHPDIDKEEHIGNHCMLIVGCDSNKKCYKVLNSWGVSFGDNGYIYMPYKYIHSKELCGNFFVIL